jgi:hypothetical protein
MDQNLPISSLQKDVINNNDDVNIYGKQVIYMMTIAVYADDINHDVNVRN